MDRLKGIKEKMESSEIPYEDYYSYPDILWLILEIERLRKELKDIKKYAPDTKSTKGK